MHAVVVFKVDVIVKVSTPLHRGRQDLVVDQSKVRRNCRGVHSTLPRETGLGVDQSCGDMRVVAAFRVDEIVGVSTPLHRGRQDLVVDQSGGRPNCQNVQSTSPRETGLGVDKSVVTCVPLLSSG
ncbi:hypothetical protein GQ457_16G016810 [Hibiscus cannabinus]